MLRLLLLLCFSFCASSTENNVCEKWGQYFTKTTGCHYNPDQNLELDELIRRHNYTVEIHNATTDDGYHLTMFRIPSDGIPILLQHGIYMSASGFATKGKNSPAFRFADAGYDVWLGNFRGTRYSRGHDTLNYDDEKYWNFWVDHLGIYDVPAQVDVVARVTGKAGKIVYAGYSMGSTASYIYALERKQEANKNLQLIISMAPIAYMSFIPSVLAILSPFWELIKPIINTQLHGRIFERTPKLEEVTRKLCLGNPIEMFACEAVTEACFGFDFGQVDPLTYPVARIQNGDAISFGIISQYVQYIRSGKFRKFDHGLRGNLATYGSITPPTYDPAQIGLPVYLINGKNDFLATPKNVEKLYKQLKNTPYGMHTIPYSSFSHGDFVNARDCIPLVYDVILERLANL